MCQTSHLFNLISSMHFVCIVSSSRSVAGLVWNDAAPAEDERRAYHMARRAAELQQKATGGEAGKEQAGKQPLTKAQRRCGANVCVLVLVCVGGPQRLGPCASAAQTDVSLGAHASGYMFAHACRRSPLGSKISFPTHPPITVERPGRLPWVAAGPTSGSGLLLESVFPARQGRLPGRRQACIMSSASMYGPKIHF